MQDDLEDRRIARGRRPETALGTGVAEATSRRARRTTTGEDSPMTALPTLPVLLPILGAALTVVVGSSVLVQRIIALTTLGAVAAIAAVLLVAADRSGPVVAALGGWAPPVGIALVADRLSALLLLVSTLVALAVLGVRDLPAHRRLRAADRQLDVLPDVPGALGRGVAAYLSGDLFTLFVSFEIMLTASYVLITRRTSVRTIRAGMTYVTVSLLSSLLFLTAVGMVYAATATVNLADLSGRVARCRAACDWCWR